jgi:TonB family protein
MSIFEFSIQGAFILALAWLVTLTLRRASASMRHLVWSSAGVALLLLPMASLTFPKMRIPIATSLSAQAPLLFGTTVTASQSTPAAKTSESPLPTTAATIGWLPMLWALGVALASLRMLTAWLAVRKLRRGARPFPGQQRVWIAPHCKMPMTCGVWNSMVYLPADAANWTEERISLVLQHEFAHIKRGDVASRLLVRAVLNLHWWNPLAWFAWRRFLREGERAADDLVLGAGVKPSTYAQQLLTIAQLGGGSSAEAWGAVAMARPAALESRLKAILDPGTNRRPPARATIAAAVLCAVVVAFPVAAVHAQEPAPSPSDLTGAAALVQRGDQARDLNRPEEAQTFYEQAAAMGPGPAPAAALLQLALLAKGHNQPVEAANFLQRALAADPDGPQAGPTLTWAAQLRHEAGDSAEAKSLFLRALALENPRSPQRAATSELYAQMLRQQGGVDEARVLEQDAGAIRSEHFEELSPKISLPQPARKIGGDVLPPKILTKVEPSYSVEARAAKWQGTVKVLVTVAEDGKAYNMQLVKSLGMGLDEAALTAISQWRFTPASQNGSPVPVLANIEVNFRLL